MQSETYLYRVYYRYNNNRDDDFLLGNITIPTNGVNAAGPRGPPTAFFNDFNDVTAPLRTQRLSARTS